MSKHKFGNGAEACKKIKLRILKENRNQINIKLNDTSKNSEKLIISLDSIELNFITVKQKYWLMQSCS